MNNTQQRSQDAASSAPAHIDTQLVERFSRLMGQRDWAVEPPRMLRDSAYAYKRLAIAFSSGDAALKALSIDLYQHYQAQAHGRRRAAGN